MKSWKNFRHKLGFPWMRSRLMGVMSLNEIFVFTLVVFFKINQLLEQDPLILKLVKKDRHELTWHKAYMAYDLEFVFCIAKDSIFYLIIMCIYIHSPWTFLVNKENIFLESWVICYISFLSLVKILVMPFIILFCYSTSGYVG